MTVKTDAVRVAVNTSLGTQDFTAAGFGAPKAAMFIMTAAITEDTAAAHANFCYGFTDGTTDHCLASTSEDAVDPTDTGIRLSLSSCVVILDAGNTTVDGEAIFDSWITDGVRIDWTNAPAAAYLLTVILFGGDDLSAFVGSQALGNSVDNVLDVTNVGFEPHLVFPASGDFLNSGLLSAGNPGLAIGAVHNDGAGGITQRSQFFVEIGGQGTAVSAMYMSALYGMGAVSSGGGLDWGGEFSDFDANGFSITTRNAGGNSTQSIHLCLAGGSPTDFAVGTSPTPTAIGNDSLTGIGFEPGLVFLGMNLLQSINDGDGSGVAAYTGGVGVFTATSEFATSISSEDAALVANCQSLSANRAIEIPDNDGTNPISATFVSMDSDGYTLNYSTVKAAARQFWYMAVKSSPPAVGDTFNEHPWVVPTTWYLPYWKHR